MAKTGVKLIANNKKAYHDYFILETYEAGISLAGTEVKSMRMGKCSIKESFIRIENGEVFVYGMHISPYEKGNIFNKDPLRVRKLLLHRQEINKLLGKMKEKGIGYGSVNHPVDRDPVCGFNGIINNECPKCHRQEGDVKFERIRRITGYLVGTLDRFNNAKRQEVEYRVKHTGLENEN